MSLSDKYHVLCSLQSAIYNYLYALRKGTIMEFVDVHNFTYAHKVLYRKDMGIQGGPACNIISA